MRKQKVMRKLITSLMVCLFVLGSLSGCKNAPQGTSSDVSGKSGSGAGQVLVLKGLENEIELTVDDVKAMPVIEKEAFKLDSKGEKKTRQVKGVLLDDILSAYGKTQSEFFIVTALADDGYQVSIPSSMLTARQLIIAYEIDGSETPLQLCVPEERAMYWVKNLSQLEFSSEQAQEQCKKVIILETAVQSLEKIEFKYETSTDRAIKVSDLVAKHLKQPADFVSITAKDGLGLTRSFEAFSSNLIKLDGDDAPLLGTPESTGAMSTKELKFVQCGDTALFFAGGSTVKTLLEELSIPVTGTFVLTGENGNTAEISAEQAASSTISISSDGTAEASGIKKLISIEVKQP